MGILLERLITELDRFLGAVFPIFVALLAVSPIALVVFLCYPIWRRISRWIARRRSEEFKDQLRDYLRQHGDEERGRRDGL